MDDARGQAPRDLVVVDPTAGMCRLATFDAFHPAQRIAYPHKAFQSRGLPLVEMPCRGRRIVGFTSTT